MKLNSLIRDSHWAWSGDPALDTPPTDASKEQVDEWAVRLTNARDTGNYAGVTKAGQALSLFSIRLIPKALFDRVLDDYHAGRTGAAVSNCLLVKLAVRGVTNLCGFDGSPFVVKLAHEPELGDVAPNDLLDLLAAYAAEARARGFTGQDPITELANHVIRRQNGPSPK